MTVATRKIDTELSLTGENAIVFKVALMVKKYLSNNPAKY